MFLLFVLVMINLPFQCRVISEPVCVCVFGFLVNMTIET